VKPLASHQKNDANDALAICEAAFRPKIHAVPIKSLAQRDLKALLTVRNTLVTRRTATANQIRALASEYGVVFSIGLKELQKQLPPALEDADNGLTAVIRRLLLGLFDDLKIMSKDIEQVTQELIEAAQQNPRFHALQKIPGFGPIIAASLLREMGTGSQFSNGRQFSAWVGLIPKQHTSGGKAQLMGMTKNGNKALRTLLIHGARAVTRFVAKRQDALGNWLQGVIDRRGKAKAIVALANKLGRIGWRILTTKEEFTVSRAFKTA
jgi:transposase